jgi:hypothetical protein
VAGGGERGCVLAVGAALRVVGVARARGRGGIRLAPLAGVVGAAAVDVVGVLCVEGLFELLCLGEVELLVGLEGSET